MKTDSNEEDRKARLNEEGKYLRVKYPSEIDWTTPLWEQLASVLKGGPSPNTSQAELRALRAKVPELSKVQFENLFPADNVITATRNHAVHKIHMSEPAAWVLNATHWFSLLDQADDDCHMVSQLGRCEQVPVHDADIASSIWRLCSSIPNSHA